MILAQDKFSANRDFGNLIYLRTNRSLLLVVFLKYIFFFKLKIIYIYYKKSYIFMEYNVMF
jgi:hypothetical protein